MIRRPPRSTRVRSSAASDVYKRQPVGSQVRPATYDEFVVPACQPSLEAIEKAGKTSALYICGDATKIAENMMYTGASCVCVDEQLSMNYIRDCALKYGRGFGGSQTDAGAVFGLGGSA